MRIPKRHNDAIVGALILTGIVGIFPALLFTGTGNIAIVIAAWAALPAWVLAKWCLDSMRYLLSTPADFTYSQDDLRGGLEGRPSEDSVMRIVEAVFRANADAGAPEDEPRKIYPCSRAIPREVWEKMADRSAKAAEELVARSAEATADTAVLLTVHAARTFDRISLGWYGSSSHSLRARPLIGQIFELLEKSENLPASDRIYCLQETAAIASSQQMWNEACHAYELLIPLTETLQINNVARACLLSNYANAARNAKQSQLTAQLKREANELWLRVPPDIIERYMLEPIS